MQGVESFSD